MSGGWIRPVAFCTALLCALTAAGEPDEAVLGRAQGYPRGSESSWYSNPYRVGSWSAMDRVSGIHTRTVVRTGAVRSLLHAPNPPAILYRYEGRQYTLDEYLERQRATGLLILKNGAIVVERYRYGRGEDARFLSFSMAKSVVSLLVGQALARGKIASLEDRAEKYATDLAGSAYGATTLRQLLRMSSGLVFTERYDAEDDIARLSRASAGVPGAATSLEVLRSVAARHAPAGTKFVYASAETEVLGRVLAAATGKTIAELTAEGLWAPIGAERDAFWRLAADGHEMAYSGFNASLRDWGRLGMLLANDGRVGEAQVVPRDYLLDATDPARQPAAFRPRTATPYFGYGYQFWLLPMRERTFAMQGVYGQGLYVQPSSGVVMVLTSVWEMASGRQDPKPYRERDALWRGVLESLGASTAE